jgi:putative addiction module component (TIGR02574 family)
MKIDINTLLALPEKQKRKIAELLWDSLPPSSSMPNEDQHTMALLEERWQNVQSGKSALYSPGQLKRMIQEHRNKR